MSVRASEFPAPGTDPGPRARFAELRRDPSTLGIVLQRLGAGESVRQIAASWRIPRRELREWLVEQGRRLIPRP